MSKAKFTPGPWVAMNGATTIYGPLGGDSGDGWAADDADGWMVAEVGNYPTLCEGEMTELGEECRRANAHLIAAAPEMYAEINGRSLNTLLGMIEDSGDAEMWAAAQGFMERRDALLRKARGES